MKKFLHIYILLYIFYALQISICTAQPEQFERRIIALYDSDEDSSAEKTLIHEHCEVILNHLGLIVDYHDIASGLPDSAMMQNCRGIISWFQDDNIPNASEYLIWLKKQITAGIKVVILGNLGAYSDRNGANIELTELNELFDLFGISMSYNETKNPFLIEVAYKDSSMIEFERSIDMELTYYSHFTKKDDSIRPYLILRRTDIPDSESPMVFTCKTGGIATSPYVYYLHPSTYRTQWRIDPFRFFKESFDIETAPVPDITTYYGSRMAFSHIDGDAFISLSMTTPNKLCGHVVIDEILSKYPFPVSVSIVVGEIIIADKKPWIKDVQTELIEPIRKMFELPNIEAAAHGYTHPLHWVNQLTAIAVEGYSEPISADNMDAIEDTVYESLSMDMAVINVSKEEMLDKEILGSIDYINANLITENAAPAGTMFWTGDCLPPHEALELCENNNISSINGGDPLFDEEYNSYTNLCAIKRASKAGWQFYTAACNENIYTNLWQGPYYGFKDVIETFKRTESPVRIKPANIYYHFYSGERHASVDALKTVYDYVIEQDFHPIFTSKYLKIARDWFATKITILEANKGFLISNNGDCRTIRIDNCLIHPDFTRSKGVIGYRHYQGSLYAHLDESPIAELWLTGQSSDDHPYLVSSTGELTEFNCSKDSISFTMNGFGKIKIEFAKMYPNTEYTVVIDSYTNTISSDDQGALKVAFPSYPRITNAHVRISSR
ncbi:MAG: DUF2194 domain-containing protein [Candidatus Auribacterota bacterium]|jgi:hypothetical protein|nr:DUF2194 domain-containing protein [Candidatus Auribacterota bacterium]